MSELLEFLTSKEIVVVYIVAAIACLLCYIIYLIDKNYYKRKQKHNTKELNKLVEEVTEIVEQDNDQTPIETYAEPILTLAVEESAQKEDANVEPVQEELVIKKEAIDQIAPEEVVETIPEAITSEPQEKIEEPINVEDLVLSTMTEEPINIVNETEVLSVADLISETKEAEPIVQEELEYTSIEPNRQQAQEELMRLTEELEKAEQEAKAIDLTSYEEEQEENAIISLDELIAKSKEMYESNEMTQYADEGNEPISIEDLERRMKKVQEDINTIEDEPVITSIIEPAEKKEETQVELMDFETVQIENTKSVESAPVKPLSESYQAVHKFERSPVISPIYGIEHHESSEDIALENTANYDKLDEEIKKTNEFLMTLRELQKNLD